jgi:hypothetical protein
MLRRVGSNLAGGAAAVFPGLEMVDGVNSVRAGELPG